MFSLQNLEISSNEVEGHASDDLVSLVMSDNLQQADITEDRLFTFLDEIELAVELPSGGLSSYIPFDVMSECSDTAIGSELDERYLSFSL